MKSLSKTFVQTGWRCGIETRADCVVLAKTGIDDLLYKSKKDATYGSAQTPIKTRITVTVTVEDV